MTTIQTAAKIVSCDFWNFYSIIRNNNIMRHTRKLFNQKGHTHLRGINYVHRYMSQHVVHKIPDCISL